MGRLSLLAALALASCHTGSANTMGGAVVMSALALGSSAVSRASGGCYAVCQQGETCNEKTGYCDPLPCRGQCRADESCEEGFFGIKCVPGGAMIGVSSKSDGPATARAVPASAPPKQDKPAVPDAAIP